MDHLAAALPAHLTVIRTDPLARRGRLNHRPGGWGDDMGSNTSSLPGWERRFPGRMQCELEGLREHATEISTRVDALKRWVLSFRWTLSDETPLHLEATFPHTFPSLRPHVRLVSGLDPIPSRHVGPINGSICLLGRNSKQWDPTWTLAKLLSEQLEDALRSGGGEDPQGEPADQWWNGLAVPDCYCLVDSAWDLGNAESGELELLVTTRRREIEVAGLDMPEIRAVVMAVRDGSDRDIGLWTGPIPADFKRSPFTIKVPWARLTSTHLPSASFWSLIHDLRRANGLLGGQPQRLVSGFGIRPFALVHPIEVAYGVKGIGWIIGGDWGRWKDFFQTKRPVKGHSSSRRIANFLLPVLRAGLHDVGIRVPAFKLLRQKRIAVFGLGALGAPLVIELARNGCAILHLIEPDIVEPGNSVRWPLGTSAWGLRKADALVDFLKKEFPLARAHAHIHAIGGIDNHSEDDLLDRVLSEVDLIVDATVAWGVTQVLVDRCRERTIPLVQVFATPTLEGGGVVRYTNLGGCPVCYELATNERPDSPAYIPQPPGYDDYAPLAQPPGCAEPTFTGASYDLAEITMQGVRLIIDTLTGNGASESLVQTLSFLDQSGRRCLPRWRVDALPPHRDCSNSGCLNQ